MHEDRQHEADQGQGDPDEQACGQPCGGAEQDPESDGHPDQRHEHDDVEQGQADEPPHPATHRGPRLSHRRTAAEHGLGHDVHDHPVEQHDRRESEQGAEVGHVEGGARPRLVHVVAEGQVAGRREHQRDQRGHHQEGRRHHGGQADHRLGVAADRLERTVVEVPEVQRAQGDHAGLVPAPAPRTHRWGRSQVPRRTPAVVAGWGHPAPGAVDPPGGTSLIVETPPSRSRYRDRLLAAGRTSSHPAAREERRRSGPRERLVGPI